ncbi:MAG: KAP family P-loop NTPase fold protein [Thermoplasmatota archaeon]
MAKKTAQMPELPPDAPLICIIHNAGAHGDHAADLGVAFAKQGLACTFIEAFEGAAFKDALPEAEAAIARSDAVLEMWWPDRGPVYGPWTTWAFSQRSSGKEPWLLGVPSYDSLEQESSALDSETRTLMASMLQAVRRGFVEGATHELKSNRDLGKLAAWVAEKIGRRRERNRTSPHPDTATLLAALHQLSDHAVANADQDVLGYNAYADALAALIEDRRTDTPLTIAVNAPWGVGKTSLANLVRDRLAYRNRVAAQADEAPPYLIVDFNAWQHDDSGDLGQALLASVLRSARARWTPRRRLFNQLPLEFQVGPERGRSYVQAAAGAGLLALAGFGVAGQALSWLGTAEGARFISLFAGGSPTLSAWLLNLAAVGGGSQLPRLQRLRSALAAFAHNPEHEADTGALEAMRSELREHLRQALPEGGRLVVFIDDLERCRPPGAADVLEFVNQVLAGPEVVVVVMAEMSGVAAQVAVKYERLARTYRPGGDVVPDDDPSGSLVFGRRYLQKIVQLQVNLPHPSSSRLQSLLEQLVAEPATRSEPTDHEPAADSPSRAERRGGLRRRGRQPHTDPGDEGARLDAVGEAYEPARARIDALESRSTAFREALEAAWPLLPGTPRHAKRFVNRLRVQIFLAESAGLFDAGTDIEPRHMALWTLVEERWPELAQGILLRPALWLELHSLAHEPDPGPLRETINRIFPAVADVEALGGFLQEHHELARILRRIVTLDPDAPFLETTDPWGWSPISGFAEPEPPPDLSWEDDDSDWEEPRLTDEPSSGASPH